MQIFNSLKEDFAFGQYIFQSLETVLAKDTGYVKWLRETGKIEVNCLYIGASQAELDRCKALNQQKYIKGLALNRPSKHVSRSKKYVQVGRALHHGLFGVDYAKVEALAAAMEDYYSEEDKCTYSTIKHQGTVVPVSYNDDGTSTVYWGGPCGSQDYDENGEEC